MGITMENDNGTWNGNDNRNARKWKNNKVTTDDRNETPMRIKADKFWWSEKMETVFHISNCPEKYQVKYATCTLLDSALTWMELTQENHQKHDACIPLVVMERANETNDRRPTRLQDAVRIANNLMDQKLKGYAVRKIKNKNRLDNTLKQPPLHHKMWEVQQGWTFDKISRTLPERFPKIKNQNKETKARVPDASAKQYALGGGDVHPGGVPTLTRLDITPYALDVSYAIELADGRTSETNTVLMGCTLGQSNSSEICPVDEKIVRIPYGNEIQIRSKETTCYGKENKDKSEEKRLEDVPIVRDFPEVFPEDLPRLPHDDKSIPN
ncbi:hypothetical protein Tco_0977442 [Tanacetum coccineum]|uniref:Reverse transcriptase domain-containing protein n=1 Tax=Tanacetum coccineum TaxID=301880 RepID=A0ABQ5EK48_9ASTR